MSDNENSRVQGAANEDQNSRQAGDNSLSDAAREMRHPDPRVRSEAAQKMGAKGGRHSHGSYEGADSNKDEQNQ